MDALERAAKAICSRIDTECADCGDGPPAICPCGEDATAAIRAYLEGAPVVEIADPNCDKCHLSVYVPHPVPGNGGTYECPIEGRAGCPGPGKYRLVKEPE